MERKADEQDLSFTWAGLSRRERKWIRSAAFRGELQRDPERARLVADYARRQLAHPLKRLLLGIVILLVVQALIGLAIYPIMDRFVLDWWRLALVVPAVLLIDYGWLRPNLRTAERVNAERLAQEGSLIELDDTAL